MHNMRSKHCPMITLRQARFLALLVCLLLLCKTCNANSSPSLDVRGSTKGTSNAAVTATDTDTNFVINERDEAIQSILSTLSSWMKEKRKADARTKRKHHLHDNLDEDIIPPQLQLPSEQSQTKKPALSRPFVTLAYAQTLDGMIAAKTSTIDEADGTAIASTSNLVLSSPESMLLTHHLRNRHDAILVGGNTFLLDQPRLNVRLPVDSIPAHGIDHPVPVVLDTNLNNLQQLLFDKIVSPIPSSGEEEETSPSAKEDTSLPDLAIDKIRTYQPPIICCSSHAAHSFLDTLEEFQEQQFTKRKPRKSYKITVYKKIDDMNDPAEDIYLPIKITIQVTHHGKKQEEDVVQDVTLTLLPCPIHETRSGVLDLKHVLHQLYDQFEIESVMVEGGAGILSSFLNESLGESGGASDEDDGNVGSIKNKVVDCICVTIAPKIIGGKWGLPVLGGLDVLLKSGDRADNVGTTTQSAKDTDGNDIESDDRGSAEMFHRMLKMKDGDFVSLGPDCTFLGRL